MGSLSTYADTILSNWLMTNTTVTRPVAWYVALQTNSSTEIGTGVGYVRQSAQFSCVNGVTKNTNDIIFGPCTTTNWGTVSYISVWDSLTGGNCLWQGQITSPSVININDKIEIPITGLTLTIS